MGRRGILYKTTRWDDWRKTYRPEIDVKNGNMFRVVRTYHEFTHGDPALDMEEMLEHQFLSGSDGTVDFVASEENRKFLESFGYEGLEYLEKFEK